MTMLEHSFQASALVFHVLLYIHSRLLSFPAPLLLPVAMLDSLPLSLSSSLPLFLSSSLPLSLSPCLPLVLSPSLPLFLSPSLPLFPSPSLPSGRKGDDAWSGAEPGEGMEGHRVHSWR